VTIPEPVPDTLGLLTRLWSSLLDVDHVDPEDDFFELGGHSALALRLRVRIERELGVRVELPLLLRNPTLTDMAAAIDTTTQD
jgi:acyl carrier protein